MSSESSEILKRLLLSLIQLPLVGGILLWWDHIKNRPVFAILVFIIYEVGVFILAFSKKVWSKLEAEAVQQTTDRILVSVQRFALRFRRRYKKQIINDHSIFNVRGLGLINTYTLSLDQVFVELGVEPGNPQKFNVDPIARKEFGGSRPIWDYLRLDQSKPSNATALSIIGSPGSGKTTLLQNVALTLAANRHRRHNIRSFTPILLFLRDHIDALTIEKPPSLGRLTQAYFSNEDIFPTLNPPSDWFEKQLQRGKCMVLLDGLDEVADKQQRKAISEWVDVQVKNYPRCKFVLTARPEGYRNAPLQRAHILEVRPFRGEQVQKFIENWYLANEVISSGGKDNIAVRQRAKKDAKDLLQRLRKSPALGALTVNPLLLTMICMVHRYQGALPGTRVELYAEICEVLLGRWRQTKGIVDTLTTLQKLKILRPLASFMMSRRLRDLSTKETTKFIAKPLKRIGVNSKGVDTFLHELQATSGLLLEREAEKWSFAHQTFQEYLTAAHWMTQKATKHDWGKMVSDSWWHETLRLYAAQGDATSIVKACLDVDSVQTLTLAVECLDEATELDPDLRQSISIRLIDDLESVDPARRRLAAEVQLSHRLRSLHRIDELREIDMEYLTCAEYQLFVDAMREQGRYYQPEHWVGFNFGIGQALSPMSGVQAREAQAFCAWLTKRHGGSVTYRLPDTDEARMYPSVTDALATWCADGAKFVLVGLSEANEQLIKQQLIELSNAKLPQIPSPDINQPLDLDLEVNFNITGNLDAVLADIMQFTHNRKLAYEVSHNLANHLPLTRNLDSSLPQTRQLARQLALSIADAFEIDHVVAAIRSNNIDEALIDARELITDSTLSQTWMKDILISTLTAAYADTGVAARRAQRRYVSQILEYLYIDITGIEAPELQDLQGKSSLKPLLLGKGSKAPKLMKILFGIYWWLQISIAREEGLLTSWEGIRIVREQVVATP